ncbi:hypothetical protein Q5H92_20700 [Hymenobacter sp. M29]|uniref:Transporter n=1 Tax=Hymenobacter mellowenesis TaxID=3063995 RepID=A0ABT9AJD0_9BACT|nr:hypothetical protein [Hymenobacter sp. M29]MDO7848797.1 hypothetical protein [Hymenobacter sp. M29]
MRLLLVFLLFLGLPGWRPAAAQTPVAPPDSLAASHPATAKPATPPRFIVDLTTANRNAYLMRAPEAADDHGYLGTQLTYQTRWGLYAGTYLNSSYGPDQPVFDDYEATLGYARTGHGPTEWNLQYTHLFVPSDSKLLRATVTDNVEGSLAHDFNFAYASLTADAFFGGSRDLVLTWNVSRALPLPVFAHDTLTITPTFELGTGTQRFYAAGLARNVREQVVTTKKNGQTKTKTSNVLETPATPGFTSTGYTLSLPVSLDMRRSSVALIPAYLVPLHVPEWGNAEKLFYVSVEFTRRLW